MTPQQYIEHGYRLSLQVSQSEIDRAEREIVYAYIAAYYPMGNPLEQPYPEPDVVTGILHEMATSEWQEGMDEIVYRSIASLTVLLLMQRGAVATRSGAKTPNALSALTPTSGDVIAQYSRDAAMWLGKLRDFMAAQMTSDEDKAMYARCNATLQDICGIFFKTNFYCG